jgi:large subunit ribosomal protein L25
MKREELLAEKRDVFGRKTNKMRKAGLIPAVVYGRSIEPASLWVKELDFSRLLKKVGESSMFGLKIDQAEERNVIVYEIQRNPLTDRVSHIDFFQVKMDEEIETEVELEFVGQSPAVVELGGVLIKNIDEVSVKCLPGDLPSKIEVDISMLKTFDDYIYIKDLNISEKVKIDIDPETVLALVTPPRTSEELAGLEGKVESDVTKVEGVVKEEKKDETKK